MQKRPFVLAVVVGALAVLLPLGGSAVAATSFGANGDVAFVKTGTPPGDIYLLSNTSSAFLTGATDPSWSPSGLSLAFSQGGAVKTCLVSSCGSPTTIAAAGTQPVWSADGTKIAYSTGGNIRTVGATGVGDALLTAGIEPSYDPNRGDTVQLAFSNGSTIYTCPVASCGSPTPIVSGTQPAWSPDGANIAYDNGTGISVIASDGSGSANVVSATGTDPSWAPQINKIVYADAGNIMVAQGSGASWTSSILTTGDATPDWQTVVPIAVGAPNINGVAQTGQLLTNDNGTWQGANPNAPFGYLYTWNRCDSLGNNCTTTVGTSSTYSPSSADIGSRLVVIVTAQNAAGSTVSAQSPPTAVVTAGALSPPVNTVYPVITIPIASNGTPNIGDFLSVSNGSWTGSFPITFTYQWKKCTSPTGPCFTIVGATHSTFTVTTDLYGMSLRAEVTAKNSTASVAQNSEATRLVSAIAPFLRVTPQIQGTVQVAQTLSLTAGTWDGSVPLTFTYSWRRCDPVGTLTSCVQVAGGTSSTYIPVVADIGFSLRVWITGTNPAGSAVAVTNHTFPVIDKAHFAPTTADSPLIVGTLEVGGLLSASIPTFSGDTPIATKQQWQRCDATGGACKNIANQTKLAYVPVEGDIGSTLRLVVTATNLYGTATSISQVTEPVIAQLPHIKGKTIKGNNKSNYLIGTAHDDTIYGYGGNDTINGNGGYDTINGGSGNDVINVSGPGRSKVNGGSGSDTIYAANNEKDTIDCGSGQDRAVIDSMDVVHNCEVVEIGGSSQGNGVIHRRGKSSAASSPQMRDARTRRAAARARSRAR